MKLHLIILCMLFLSKVMGKSVKRESDSESLFPSHGSGPRKKYSVEHCTMNRLFCIPANYSKYVPPIMVSRSTKPLDVFVGFDNFEILKIDDRDFTVEINAYLLVKWSDKRILVDFTKYIPNLDEDTPDGSSYYPNETIRISQEILDRWQPVELELVGKLWLPDSEILRLKSFHSLSVLDRLQGLWMTLRHGILFVLATRIRFMCPMNYAKFPMDVQTCKFQIGSFNYDNTKMRYHTDVLPSLPNSTDSILDYDVKIVPLLPHQTYYLPAETGNYSVAGFRLVLTRKISHYMITYYLPSGLFVVVSWASFLIPSDDIQGRMALLVTLFLVLVNIFNAITTNSPKADGLNALQAWVITCIFFVFGALSEYAIILLQVKIRDIQSPSIDIPASLTAVLPIPNGNPALQTHCQNRLRIAAMNKLTKKERLMAKLDITCLIVFPILFLLFVLIYGLCVQFL